MNELKFCGRLNVLPEFCEYADYDAVERIVKECEKNGYHSVWVMDHLFWEKGALLECWVSLSALASATSSIRFGPLVSCNSYRLPSIMAKMSATLDVISNGRLEFGIGAGWKEDEYKAYGIPFTKPSVRIAQLREGVEIVKLMWTEEKPSFKGKYYWIKEAECNPKPVQKPHPPIWIGGSGEKLLLRVVAEKADGCNFSGSLDEYKHKLDILRNHCKKVGRDFNKIKKSLSADLIISDDVEMVKKKVEMFKPENLSLEDYDDRSIIGTPEECIARINDYHQLGVTYFMLSLRTFKEDISLFAEKVIRKL
jgi:F420-dependent oxidoreductase-like protein